MYNNLNKLYWIKKDIESITQELDEITYIGSAPITDMPRSNKKSDPAQRIAEKKIKLQNILTQKLEKYYEEKLKIEKYIDTIDDVSIQVIARRRFIFNETWEKISETLNYDRTYCYRKLINYINKKDN